MYGSGYRVHPQDGAIVDNVEYGDIVRYVLEVSIPAHEMREVGASLFETRLVPCPSWMLSITLESGSQSYALRPGYAVPAFEQITFQVETSLVVSLFEVMSGIEDFVRQHGASYAKVTEMSSQPRAA